MLFTSVNAQQIVYKYPFYSTECTYSDYNIRKECLLIIPAIAKRLQVNHMYLSHSAMSWLDVTVLVVLGVGNLDI